MRGRQRRPNKTKASTPFNWATARLSLETSPPTSPTMGSLDFPNEKVINSPVPSITKSVKLAASVGTIHPRGPSKCLKKPPNPSPPPGPRAFRARAGPRGPGARGSGQGSGQVAVEGLLPQGLHETQASQVEAEAAEAVHGGHPQRLSAPSARGR